MTRVHSLRHPLALNDQRQDGEAIQAKYLEGPVLAGSWRLRTTLGNCRTSSQSIDKDGDCYVGLWPEAPNLEAADQRLLSQDKKGIYQTVTMSQIQIKTVATPPNTPSGDCFRLIDNKHNRNQRANMQTISGVSFYCGFF